MIKQTKVWLVLSFALSLVLAAACSKSDSGTNLSGGETSSAAGPYSGPTGSVAGVISFEGTPPAPRKIEGQRGRSVEIPIACAWSTTRSTPALWPTRTDAVFDE